MSDERDGAGSAGDGTDNDELRRHPRSDRGRDPADAPDGQAVAARRGRRGCQRGRRPGDRRPRPRPPRTAAGTATKTAKKSADRPSRNPFAFVWNYLKQVVAELRKVIWPNRKQMVSYTTVVLVFLAFMVALIGLVDLGLAKLVMLVFG